MRKGWEERCVWSRDQLTAETTALRGIQWNFTHYTYTCSSGGLESDTLHLYLQGPKGCTRRSGILHWSIPDPYMLMWAWEKLRKQEKEFCGLDAGIHSQETFAVCLSADFSHRFLCLSSSFSFFMFLLIIAFLYVLFKEIVVNSSIILMPVSYM